MEDMRIDSERESARLRESARMRESARERAGKKNKEKKIQRA